MNKNSTFQYWYIFVLLKVITSLFIITSFKVNMTEKNLPMYLLPSNSLRYESDCTNNEHSIILFVTRWMRNQVRMSEFFSLLLIILNVYVKKVVRIRNDKGRLRMASWWAHCILFVANWPEVTWPGFSLQVCVWHSFSSSPFISAHLTEFFLSFCTQVS